jgi:hypothetical protein
MEQKTEKEPQRNEGFLSKPIILSPIAFMPFNNKTGSV